MLLHPNKIILKINVIFNEIIIIMLYILLDYVQRKQSSVMKNYRDKLLFSEM